LRDALTRAYARIFDEGGQRTENREQRTENREQRTEGKRSGLGGFGVTLLRSVSVNLAELRRAQTRDGEGMILDS